MLFLRKQTWAEGWSSPESWRGKAQRASSNDQCDVHPRGKLFPGIITIDNLTFVNISITTHPSLSASPGVPRAARFCSTLGEQLRGGDFNSLGVFSSLCLFSQGKCNSAEKMPANPGVHSLAPGPLGTHVEVNLECVCMKLLLILVF